MLTYSWFFIPSQESLLYYIWFSLYIINSFFVYVLVLLLIQYINYADFFPSQPHKYNSGGLLRMG